MECGGTIPATDAGRFMRAMGRMNRNAHRIRPAEMLPRGLFEMMMMLDIRECHGKGPLRISELGDEMERPLPAISRWVSDLEERGLVRRVTGEDRRTVCVEMTDAGRENQRQAKAVLLETVGQLEERMGKEDFDRLVALMERAGDLLQEISEEKL